MKRFLIIAAIIALLLVSPARAASIYYSSPSGSGSACTISSPCNLSTGIGKLASGDTLIVQAGNYSSQRTSISKSGITLQGAGALTKGFNVSANNVTIDGFEIANTAYSTWGYSNGAGIYNTGSNNIFQNNYIHDASLVGLYLAGSNNIARNNRLFQDEMVGIDVHGTNNLIEGNEVWATVQCHPNLSSCVSGLDADGMRFWGSGHTFRGNYIHDIKLGYTINGKNVNPSPHIDCFQTFTNGGEAVGNHIIFERNYCVNYDGTSAFMLEGGVSYLYIRNNIFETATGISAYGDGGGGSDYLYIYNNIWVGSKSARGAYPSAGKFEDINHIWFENNILYNQYGDPPFFLGSTSNIVFDYNLTYNSDGSKQHCVEWGSFDSCIPSALHNLFNVNPKFVSASDYHLQVGSPAIDAGASVPVINDYDGNYRPQGLTYDIGPFEYAGVVLITSTPTWTPTVGYTFTPTASRTRTPIPPTAAPTETNTPTPVLPTAAPTETDTLIPSVTIAPTYTPTYSQTPTQTITSTPVINTWICEVQSQTDTQLIIVCAR